MKVSKDFYCMVDRVSYKKGDEYKGNRKDIGHLLEKEPKKEPKKAPANKKSKAKVDTKDKTE